MTYRPSTTVGICGSPASTSKSRVLLEYALSRLQEAGADTVQVDLHALPAAPLLGRVNRAVSEALALSQALPTASPFSPFQRSDSR